MFAPNLLVTDDDSALREILCEGLTRMGVRVTAAGDGAEAIDMLRRLEVHFCLIDFHMPRVNGLDVIRHVQEHQADVPCVLMSADLSDQIRDEAKTLDIYAVLSKPIRLTHLGSLVREALRDAYGWSPDAKL